MNQSMQPAIQHLFQVSSLEDVSRERLENSWRNTPVSALDIISVRKLRAENADQFLAATRKTSLYFSNPFWLQWMLENAPQPEEIYSPAPEPAVHEHSPAPEPFTQDRIPEPFTQDRIPEPAPMHPEEPIYDEEPPFVPDAHRTGNSPACGKCGDDGGRGFSARAGHDGSGEPEVGQEEGPSAARRDSPEASSRRGRHGNLQKIETHRSKEQDAMGIN